MFKLWKIIFYNYLIKYLKQFFPLASEEKVVGSNFVRASDWKILRPSCSDECPSSGKAELW